MSKARILFSLLLVGVSLGVSAQLSDSATLLLTGTVGQFVSIDVTPAPAASALTLSVAQSTPLDVGTVTESSNTAYAVTAGSANGFSFANAGADSVPYTLWYDGAAVTANGATVSSGSSASNVVRSVAVTYAAAGTGVATGVYSDTVTFTISTN